MTGFNVASWYALLTGKKLITIAGFLVFIQFYFSLTMHAQVIYPVSVTWLPSFIHESSGVVFFQNEIITHNDGDNPPVLFRLSPSGQFHDSLRIRGLVNTDWEDISVYKDKVYIAETGNNLHNRKVLCIHQLDSGLRHTGTWKFTYGKQTQYPPQDKNLDFDCEALTVYNDTAYLLSKSWAKPYHGITYAYRLPLNGKDTIRPVYPVDSFNTGKKQFLDGSVTASDMSPGEKYFAFITCKYLFLFFNFKDKRYLQGRYAVFYFGSTTQREAVAFTSDSTLVVTDEQWMNAVGRKLYQYNLSPYLNGKIRYTVPEVMACTASALRNNKIEITVKINAGSDSLRVTAYSTDNEPVQESSLIKTYPGVYKGSLITNGKKPAYIRVYQEKRMIICQAYR